MAGVWFGWAICNLFCEHAASFPSPALSDTGGDESQRVVGREGLHVWPWRAVRGAWAVYGLTAIRGVCGGSMPLANGRLAGRAASRGPPCARAYGAQGMSTAPEHRGTTSTPLAA